MTEQTEQTEQTEERQALVSSPPPEVGKDRRVLRAVLRWTAVAVVFAAVGTAAAYGITRPERTDLPGLATESDGRWDYPEIVRPPLPSGSPAPFAEANKAAAHHADLRALVLPAPKGAKVDTALRGEDGWLGVKTFLAEYASTDDRETIEQMLTDYGLRHIAAHGWTMRDGTRTRIYLLRFATAAVVDDLLAGKLTAFDNPRYHLRGTEEVADDEQFPASSQVDGVVRVLGNEAKPYGAEQVRHAYLGAGDTVALIVQSRRGTAEAVPFQQTVVLQSQLLS
ncbi:hypothetical protein [Streptomyces sp. NPDC050988]|uniref:hypothetical protein n=1 Tax=Streptomyces sp. NPDC050988 TaxID=3365637 RepID=UPI0037B5B3DA